MSETIEKLIERLERATGPDRELDCLIGVASGRYGRTQNIPYDYFRIESETQHIYPRYGGDRLVPRFTSSIDAKLQGEDIVAVAEQKPHPDKPNETKWMALQRGAKIAAYGRTEALARRIAGLRARLAGERA